MSDPSIAQLEQSLTRALLEADRRLTAATDRATSAIATRATIIANAVAAIVPDLSSSSFDRVHRLLPSALTPSMRMAFQQRKWLGFIPTKSYARALDAVRTALTAYLDQTEPRQLHAVDGQVRGFIEQLTQTTEAARSFVNQRNEDARRREDLARCFERIQIERRRGASTIPAALVPRLAPQRMAAGAARFSLLDDSSSDFDLWLYFLADIPTSARTFLFSAIAHESAAVQHATIPDAQLLLDPDTTSADQTDDGALGAFS